MELDRTRLAWGIAAAVASCAVGAITGTELGTALGVLALVATGAALVVFARVTVAHCRLARLLRQSSSEAEVAGTRLRLGPVGRSVFVAGLIRPQIYCDRGLLDELDDDEVSAVLLHERAHQLARDPLRSAALATLAPLLTLSERGQGWLERRAAVREIAADRHAVAQGARPRAIASALFKVAPADVAHAAAFAPAVELRLRALLGDEVVVRRPWWRAAAAGAMVGVPGCLVMLHHVSAPALLAVCCPI